MSRDSTHCTRAAVSVIRRADTFASNQSGGSARRLPQPSGKQSTGRDRPVSVSSTEVASTVVVNHAFGCDSQQGRSTRLHCLHRERVGHGANTARPWAAGRTEGDWRVDCRGCSGGAGAYWSSGPPGIEKSRLLTDVLALAEKPVLDTMTRFMRRRRKLRWRLC